MVPDSVLASRTWSFQFLVVVKVKVFKVFLLDNGSGQHSAVQNVHIPVPHTRRRS